VLGGLGLLATALIGVVAGTGWLYLLRSGHLLGFGPRVPGSLELEQLASADAQPLARLVAAWLPAGLVVGLALGGLWHRSAGALAMAEGLLAAALLLLTGAISDAVENSQSVTARLSDQPGRAGPWVAACLLLIGTYLGGRARAARRAHGAPASTVD
jgi:hypothetical protein